MRDLQAFSLGVGAMFLITVLFGNETNKQLIEVQRQNTELNKMFTLDYKTLAKHYKLRHDSLELFKKLYRASACPAE